MNEIVSNPALCEPFSSEGRETPRLLHDLGAMLSLMKHDNRPVLDFGAGSGWITECLAKMGRRVTAFDIHPNLEGCIGGRTSADKRIDPSLITVASGDGHAMPFSAASFGHVLCYDTLHHMHDYGVVFREFFRVLAPNGRAIFVEPGAKHASSTATIEFMKLKRHDPTWIERDVVLEDINACAVSAGFSSLTIIPMQHPSSPKTYCLRDWQRFREGDRRLRGEFADSMATLNYDDRVIFFFDN